MSDRIREEELAEFVRRTVDAGWSVEFARRLVDALVAVEAELEETRRSLRMLEEDALLGSLEEK